MHKVFISYHHKNDQLYKDHLIYLNKLNNIFIDKSVNTGDISDALPHQSIRLKIRDEYLRDSTVTILLLGTETKYRKHIDWELKSSMINGIINKRSGILVITLPSIGCNSWLASHPNETNMIYPEYSDWSYINNKSDYEVRYPYMPKRIIDNLISPNVNISVVPWHKIENNFYNLQFLISATANSRSSNLYDLSEPMRMRDYNPTPLYSY